MASSPFLPYGRQHIDQDDIDAVVRVLRSECLTGGSAVTEFERKFSQAVGSRYAVACANGTAALHMAVMALGLGRGDVAIVPTLTFLATANAARFVDAEIVFSDVDRITGLMTPEDLREALNRSPTKLPKVVMPVHLNGQCADMRSLSAIARERGLGVIEDACHAVGASYDVDSGEVSAVGSCRYSDMTVFSFHPVKTIAMGEGGMVTTNDSGFYKALQRLRSHGMVRDSEDFVQAEEGFDLDGLPHPWYYEMPDVGFNYRASDIHCALGLSQLGKLSMFLERRRLLAKRYDELLAPYAPAVTPLSNRELSRDGLHLYVIHIDFDAIGISRAALIRKLLENGIGAQVHYLPVHRQPYYRNRYKDLNLTGADLYYSTCLSLPLFPAMGEGDVERVITALCRSIGFAA